MNAIWLDQRKQLLLPGAGWPPTATRRSHRPRHYSLPKTPFTTKAKPEVLPPGAAEKWDVWGYILEEVAG